MGALFQATIKMNANLNGWYIELLDMEEGSLHECDDLDLFEAKLTELARNYNNEIEEVRWLKDDNVPPLYLNEVRLGIMALEQKIAEGEPSSL